jgi:hypothetical protein
LQPHALVALSMQLWVFSWLLGTVAQLLQKRVLCAYLCFYQS